MSKYRCGDYVYYLDDMKIEGVRIRAITNIGTVSRDIFSYEIVYGKVYKTVEENRLFESPKALKDYIGE